MNSSTSSADSPDKHSHPTDSAEPVLLVGSRFRVVRVQQPLAAGGFREREVVRHPGAVVLLPLIDDNHLCLIRNYRISIRKTLIELPAGTLEPGEPPIETAARELEEETGYVAEQLQLLHTYYPSPGVLDELMYLYVATGLTPGPARREAGEEIDNLIVSWDEALAMIDRGEIVDSKTLVGLLLFQRWRRSPPPSSLVRP